MFRVNTENCIGCGQCARDCFPNDIEIIENKAVIKNEACIKCGHCVAVCPVNAVSTDEYNMNDVVEYSSEAFDIAADNLLNFIKFRRTIRQFKDKPVETEKIMKIIEAGRFTETASNLQDVSYIVVKDNIHELKTMALESLKEKGEAILANESSNMLFKRYAKMWISMYEQSKIASKDGDRLFYNAPTVIIVTAVNDINGGLASSNMELMTKALGLGTLFSGFFVRAAKGNKKIKDFLGIKDGSQIITCMVIGYPDVKYKRTVPRKSPDITWK